MKTCTVLVGLPAAGKSTWTRFLDNPEFGDTVFVYSTDAYIEEQARAFGKTYDEIFSDYIKKAQIRMAALLDIAIKEGIDVIWDQTNLGAKKRAKIVNKMKSAGYKVNCVCFNPPETVEDIAEWNRRLHSREGKTIPSHVIENMVKTYQEPSVDEGFDIVKFYDIYGNLVGAVK